MIQSLAQQVNNPTYPSNEEINRLEIISFDGVIHYIDSDLKLYNIQLPNEKFIGFDTETKPSFEKNRVNPLSIIQIATEKDAYIFQLKKIKNKERIIEYLNSNNIIKIGSGISDDFKKIEELCRCHLNKESFIDLQKLIRNFKLPKSNLRFLTAYFLNKRIIKSSQTSNWNKHPLTEKQLLYAATDAWICLKIYQKIQETYCDTL